MEPSDVSAVILVDMHLHRFVTRGKCEVCGGSGEDRHPNQWSVSSVARELQMPITQVRVAFQKLVSEQKLVRVGGHFHFGDDSKEHPESDDWLYGFPGDQPRLMNEGSNLFRAERQLTFG